MPFTSRWIPSMAFLLAAGFLLPAALLAQVSNGRIEGVVTDPAGAVVPNATVSARNNRTGTVVTANTNETGYYLFASLPPSNYTLTVEAPGFRKAQVENIELNVAVTLRQDVQLEVGSLAESVTVEASAIRVNTSDAQIGRSVTLRDIDTLPQLGRNPMALVPYTPGVSIDPGDNSFSRVNGTRQGSNNTRLDGIDANDAVVPRLGLSLTAFNVDSIEEFRVITNGGKAEYGRNAGGQVEMITRSGTNQWRGNAFEFLRNTKLNANNFFNNASGVARPKFIQNTFGASLGGPIMKEKWFVFGNWQTVRTAQEVVRNRTVLTPEAKRGLFRWNPPAGGGPQSFDIVANDPRKLGFDPATKKLIDMLPDPNNFDVGDGLNTAGFPSTTRPASTPTSSPSAAITTFPPRTASSTATAGSRISSSTSSTAPTPPSPASPRALRAAFAGVSPSARTGRSPRPSSTSSAWAISRPASTSAARRASPGRRCCPTATPTRSCPTSRRGGTRRSSI